jgi:hypothetical protein
MVNLALVGSNDDIIEFTDTGDFVLMTGLTGTGIPATEVRISPSASNGGTWRFTKRGIREMDLPIMVSGTSRADIETKLIRLSNLLQDTAGGTRLRATYPTGEVWELSDGHYISGAETQWGSSTGLDYARWVLTMQFANPFWVRQQSESFALGAGAGTRSLIPNLAEMAIVGSQVIGNVEIENSGNVDAYPVWIFRGPAESIFVQAQSGLSFTYEAPIAQGETITVDTRLGTVTSTNGENQYSNLGTSPKLFPIPSGTSQISIEAIGADEYTLVSMFYRPRKEVVH